MTVGELAKAAQCSVETIRYYEKEGLLPQPARTAGNYRRFGPAHLERLRLIRNCRSLDMTHQEIRALLALLDRAGQDCGVVDGLLDEHIDHVRARIAELTRLLDQLRTLRDRCQAGRPVEDCGILHGLVEMEGEAGPAHATHLG